MTAPDDVNRRRDSTPDRILIEGLRLSCVIGVNDWERLVRQEIVIDIALHVDTRTAARSDSIEDTVSYRTVSKRVIEHVTGSQYRLIEALAGSVADICLQEPAVQKVDVTVRKPGAVTHADSVGVAITRERR